MRRSPSAGRWAYTHACGVLLQSARLVSQASIRFVQVSKSAGTSGNDVVSGVVISSGGGGGICAGGTGNAGQRGIEALQAVSSKLISSKAASFFDLVIMGDLSVCGLQGLFTDASILTGRQGVGSLLGDAGVPLQAHLVAAGAVGREVCGGQECHDGHGQPQAWG